MPASITAVAMRLSSRLVSTLVARIAPRAPFSRRWQNASRNAWRREVGARRVWLAASSQDPYSLRTLKELTADESTPRDQQLSSMAAHGTNLLTADPDLTRALVDWLRQRLLF